MRQYQITSTPTYVVLEGGVEVERTQSISVLITILVKLLAFLLPLMLG
jgi:predicted DsbA family dithiol-disulfide isomerase